MEKTETRTRWTNRRVALVVVLTALLTGGLVWVVAPRMALPRHSDKVFYIIERFDGVSYFETPNDITDIGETQARVRFSTNGSYVALYWISLGNVSGTLATKTQLDTEYSRQKGTITTGTLGGDAIMNVTYKWTFGSVVRLDGSGSHWASSGDSNMYSVANFPSGAQTFQIGENLTVKWTHTFNGN